MNPTNRAIGDYGEQIAVDFLVENDVEIVDRNIRTDYGEIDILGRKDGILIFFEVKTRRSVRYGNPEESVNKKKQEHMKNSAIAYIQAKMDINLDWRIDLLAINIYKDKKKSIRWFKNVVTG